MNMNKLWTVAAALWLCAGLGFAQKPLVLEEANWRTAITDSVALSIGVTYDYYSVSDADATTFWNSEYWLDAYAVLRQKYIANGVPESEVDNVMLNGNDVYKPNDLAVLVKDLEANNWEDKVDGEIESFYKSLGVRIGINARF